MQRVIQYLRLAKVGGGSNGERAASYLSGANLKVSRHGPCGGAVRQGRAARPHLPPHGA